MRFYDEVLERSQDLVHAGIWAAIHPARLRTWLNNFTSDEEKYFCACVLDNLIYRSEDQTSALATQVFQRALPDVARLHPTPLGMVDDWLAMFCGASDPGARIVPVLKPGDMAGKSGDVIARLLRRGFRVHPGAVIQPNQCSTASAQGISTFIFVDDFLGTGNQFRETIIASGLEPLLSSAYCIYAPFAAHVKGIEFLSVLYPNLHLCPGEVIDWSHSIFHAECPAFSDGMNSVPEALAFYHELLEKRGLCNAALQSTSSIPVDPALIPWGSRTGYGDLGLAYAFSHAVPDNCLPILWWSRGRNWNPLFNR